MVKNLEDIKARVEKHKFELFNAKHNSQWRTRFVLPDTNHCIDGHKIQYLDKGIYSVGDEDLIEPPMSNKQDFRLYFKPLGSIHKDKVMGDLPNSQSHPRPPL